MYSSDIRSCREVEDTTCLQAYISNGILHIILRKIVVDDIFHQLHSFISVFKGISIRETDVDIKILSKDNYHIKIYGETYELSDNMLKEIKDFVKELNDAAREIKKKY